MIEFSENAKRRIYSVTISGTICPIIKHKNICGSTLILVKVVMIQIVPNPKQDKFSGCFGLFFSSFLKTRKFPDM